MSEKPVMSSNILDDRLNIRDGEVREELEQTRPLRRN
jgi:hypothetical protein